MKTLIATLSHEFGFSKATVSDCKLNQYHSGFKEKIAQNMFGDMHYMQQNLEQRLKPSKLVTGTKSIIVARMNYFPPATRKADEVLNNPAVAYISRYALGRDYHKVFRNKLKKFAESINNKITPHKYRVFTDSAPVMELNLAQKSGIGWLGKNSCIIDRNCGSWFFLGEIYTDLELEPDKPTTRHCGTCTACINKCPTQAFIEPYLLDARKCVSYLTIEHKGSIPENLRPLIGNRIFGCDDCQLVCPWNKFTQTTNEPDFAVRHQLDDISLIELASWSEDDFNSRLAGSAIRRIGFERWQRNIAVALGNSDLEALSMLNKITPKSEMVKEHIAWAKKNLS